MISLDPITLNTTFGIPDQLVFRHGPGNLIMAFIENQHATAAIALQGAHVVAFHPRGHASVLWTSSLSRYELGKAIRGGIPVCWPWFGPHPNEHLLPAHGFVRTSLWTVLGSAISDTGSTELRLGLADNEATQALWPYSFQLELIVTVGQALDVELVVRNTGSEAFTYSGALHHYFRVSDVTAISIHGLEGSTYIDKVDAQQRKEQHGPVMIAAEIDHIYLNTSAPCIIADPGLGRKIEISKSGSHSTVVWNPWQAKAQQLVDFGDHEYKGMVCVETANAGDDTITVVADAEHRLRSSIRTIASDAS